MMDLVSKSMDHWIINSIPRFGQIYSDINNGVYKSGFSTSQIAYDEAQV